MTLCLSLLRLRILVLVLINIFSSRILTGCYDATLHLWTAKGKHKQGLTAHEGPIKAVCWIASTEESAVFAR